MNRRQPGGVPARAALVIAAGLVIADVSVVTLALPQLLSDLHTSIAGVAAVLGLYTFVLAIALPVFARIEGRLGSRTLGIAGFGVFAIGAVVCASVGTLALLLGGRALQALGGAAALIAAFGLLDARGRGRTAWLSVAVLSGAVGPALGGALTEAFDWRAIFVVQVPLALIGMLASVRTRRALPPRAAPTRPERRPMPASRVDSLALTLLSGALSAILFLLVLLVVAGWNVPPLHAAVAVSVLPIAALLGTRLRGEPRPLASAGCVLLGCSILALAWLPEARLGWTLLPQALGGVGMGMALHALTGSLLSERTPREAARLLSLRHLGIAVVLLALAPLITDQLESATHEAKLRGIALVLDAPLEPQKKIELAPALLGSIEAARPRASLDQALAAQRRSFTGPELVSYEHLSTVADDTLLSAIAAAFRDAFLVAGALALIAAALTMPGRSRARAAVVGTFAVAILVPLAFLLERGRLAPAPVRIANPCLKRVLHPSRDSRARSRMAC